MIYCSDWKSKIEDAAKILEVELDYGAEIKEGDTYLAYRNTDVKLLTCLVNNKGGGWFVPKETAYSFDTHECVKIKI